jgi:hypothetical protein
VKRGDLMSDSYAGALALAIEAARDAAIILRRDYHLPAGPRGEHRHADADDEAQAGHRRPATPFP